MATKLTLLNLPEEVLLIVFRIHFSDITVDVKRSRIKIRKTTVRASVKPPAVPRFNHQCLNALLVNKALHPMAQAAFYEAAKFYFPKPKTEAGTRRLLHFLETGLPIRNMVADHLLFEQLCVVRSFTAPQFPKLKAIELVCAYIECTKTTSKSNDIARVSWLTCASVQSKLAGSGE